MLAVAACLDNFMQVIFHE